MNKDQEASLDLLDAQMDMFLKNIAFLRISGGMMLTKDSTSTVNELRAAMIENLVSHLASIKEEVKDKSKPMEVHVVLGLLSKLMEEQGKAFGSTYELLATEYTWIAGGHDDNFAD